MLPKQLVAGTEIAAIASGAYGPWNGITPAEYMQQRFETPLAPDGVARAILDALRGGVAAETIALGVTARGIEPIA